MAEYQLKTGKVGKKVVEENKHEKKKFCSINTWNNRNGIFRTWNVHGTDRRMGNVSAGSYRRCDRTCRHYRTVNVNSIDQRIKIKIIENIIYAKDTAYRMKIL